MNEAVQTHESVAVELLTERSLIVGKLVHQQSIARNDLISLLNLDAYALSGRRLLDSGRLVDMLNRSAGYITLRDVQVHPYVSSDCLEHDGDEMAINTGAILCAVPSQQPAATRVPEGTGRVTGEMERELRRVELQVGPFRINGDLHALPGSNPRAFYFGSERSFVPLTSVTAIYLPNPTCRWIRDVVIVNVEQSQTMVVSEDQHPSDQPISSEIVSLRIGRQKTV